MVEKWNIEQTVDLLQFFYTAVSASDENLAYTLSTCDNTFEDDV